MHFEPAHVTEVHPRMPLGPLRICLLTYRGNPRSGGQGIYVRLLSKALVDLGHAVDVWSGPPYPELFPGVNLVKIPSLDLWNEEAMMRTPSLRELIDPINLSEWARTRVGGFPEPLTFSQRVARRFRRGATHHYDIVHDNQCLGPGLLEIQAALPVVATIHHPITVDRRIAYDSCQNQLKRYGLRRWYSFLETQLKVSRRLDRVLTVSQASQHDLQREYGLDADRMRVVGNGINLDVFGPIPELARDPNQLITTMSSDTPLKGFRYLLEALALLRAEGRTELRLKVFGRPGAKTDTQARVDRLGLDACVEFTGHVSDGEIARAYARASVAIVPSLYEGFGFPAGEAMACEVPVVSTSAGALPEVVGPNGASGRLVPPSDARALANAVAELLDDPESATALGRAGRKRVLSQFTWKRAAERTTEVYHEALRAPARLPFSSIAPARTVPAYGESAC